MNKEHLSHLKKKIIATGRLLWEKDLASGLNGNISMRVDEKTVLLTAHKTCLGLLQEKDILQINLDGSMLEEGQVSTEKLLHTQVYQNFTEAHAVVHTHTTYTNAYFLAQKNFQSRIFESKLFLGEVVSVDQATPAVTDAGPVMEQLKRNNVVVLRNHGVVAMGRDLFDCFLLVQSLEEAVKVEAISRLFQSAKAGPVQEKQGQGTQAKKRYQLFSQEQIDDIVRIVNADESLARMGQQTSMTMDLAVKLNETGQVYSFQFEQGKIKNVGRDENAEFLISAPASVWRAVFNREIDPFVATTQKKMNLKGDFAKISRWYAPCSRIFELWQQVPVE